MTKFTPLTLQNWKKPPKLDSRGNISEANEALGNIIAAPNEKEIKDLLVMVKINESVCVF